jgi:hypothetical protein
MTSTKTQNSSQAMKLEVNKNSFFVSESIQHLIDEEVYLNNIKDQNATFAASDILIKVFGKENVVFYELEALTNELVSVNSDGKAMQVLYKKDKPISIEIVLSNSKEPIDKLKCDFYSINKLSNGEYNYKMKIINHMTKEVL